MVTLIGFNMCRRKGGLELIPLMIEPEVGRGFDGDFLACPLHGLLIFLNVRTVDVGGLVHPCSLKSREFQISSAEPLDSRLRLITPHFLCQRE